mmetsp:Transcript_21648/g.26895  ORF Transcript_21648/g.26895 Transcript_21648/m.26895 type:complete len:256 (+) Transcript_21648:1-768(+)
MRSERTNESVITKSAERHAFEKCVLECQVAVTVFLFSPIFVLLVSHDKWPYGKVSMYAHRVCICIAICLWLRISLFLSPDATSQNHAKIHLCHHCGAEVEGFDHHCVYVNRCVGKKNYCTFLCLLASLATLQIFQFWIAATCLKQNSGFEEPWCLVTALVSAPLGIATFGLLCFHFYLRFCLRTTTYAWILDRRRKSLEAQMDAEKKAFMKRETEREYARRQEYQFWAKQQKKKKLLQQNDSIDQDDDLLITRNH